MASHLFWLPLFFISSLFCSVAASILFHLKNRRTSSSSSTATCSPDSASPSSSSVGHPEIEHDVFLSFRGTDTRFGFLSHLLKQLSRKKVVYFVDDENLEPGEEISSALLSAVEKSEISLVVFSKGYADSIWCLKELEQVIQCMENKKQTVIPIFYKVDPSTVRHQIRSYKDAFEKHGKRFDRHSLQKWKTALNKAANLSGFDSSKYRTEADFVTEIVEFVLKRLNMTSYQGDLKGLVGIQKHIVSLEALLCKKTKDVIIIGIWGMGGIGKTTIAKVLFNRLYNEFEGNYFLNVREWLEKHGRELVKEKLLSQLLGEDAEIVMHNGLLSNCQKRLRRKKVFVVLDNINSLIQREILTDGHEFFGPNSRIIVTSRNKDLFNKKCDHIYDVKPLDFIEAFQLFNLNALPEVCFFNDEEWYELLRKLVEYCKGNPLAIKVLGCSLCSRDKNEWKSKLKKLDNILDPDIQDVLQQSYNELDYKQKDVFLYLACFFKCATKEGIISLLDDDEYHTIDGLEVLQNKALITISSEGDVSMHDLNRRMGREIARNKCLKYPGQRNHLCDADDIYKVFKNNMGTEEIESIKLEMWKLKRDLHLTSQSFSRMDNLKLLRFQGPQSRFRMYAPVEDFILPAQLTFISWDAYPLKSMDPLRSCLDNLVELRMRESRLQKLWDGIQELPSLKVIDLCDSRMLTELPDLSKAPRLESVILYFCMSLQHVPLWPSTSTLRYVLLSLRHLNLSDCRGISELPSNIGVCLPSLQSLDISNTKVKALPESIMHLAKLTALRVSHCRSLEIIPESIKHLPKLTSLNVSYCKSLETIPELPPSIESLTANECNLLEQLKFSSKSMHLSHRKCGLYIGLQDCMELGERTIEEVAMHYKRSTQIMMSTGKESSNALLYFSGSKVPECFRNCCPTNDSVSAPLNLPLYFKAMGFIFYFLIEFKSYLFKLRIKCHIELGNAAKEQFICGSTDLPKWKFTSDHVFLLYEGSLSLKLIEELSRIKASATTNDGHIKVWFELLDNESNDLRWVKEWGVYCITSSESLGTRKPKMSRY